MIARRMSVGMWSLRGTCRRGSWHVVWVGLGCIRTDFDAQPDLSTTVRLTSGLLTTSVARSPRFLLPRGGGTESAAIGTAGDALSTQPLPKEGIAAHDFEYRSGVRCHIPVRDVHGYLLRVQHCAEAPGYRLSPRFSSLRGGVRGRQISTASWSVRVHPRRCCPHPRCFSSVRWPQRAGAGRSNGWCGDREAPSRRRIGHSGAEFETQTRAPVPGCTVPYTLANVLLTLAGPVVVLMT